MSKKFKYILAAIFCGFTTIYTGMHYDIYPVLLVIFFGVLTILGVAFAFGEK
jgi:hypothetical protein